MATLFNLPASVPKVTLNAKYVGPDGRPLSGWVEILAPTPLVFPNTDAFITGPLVMPLDAEGGFSVTLPATDVAGQNPTSWAYRITERIDGMEDREPYAIKLPQSLVNPWLDNLAPKDPQTPSFIPVVGSQIYQGSTTPPANLGQHNDVYIRTEVTAVFLNVTDARVTVYQNEDGTWVLQSGEVRGSKIYLNNTATPSTATRPGDLLIRTDNGDLYQREATGWGPVKANIKGPKGDTGTTGTQGIQGVQGPKGDKGDPGTGSGTVITVNGKSPNGAGAVTLVAADVGAGTGTVKTVNAKTPDGAGSVVLAAADVGAVANTVPVTAKATTAATDPFRVVDDTDAQLFSVRKTGSTYTPAGNGYFNKNIRVGGSASAGGIGTAVNGVLALDNGTGPSAANTAGVHLYATAGQLVVQEQSGRYFNVNEGTRNAWTPDSLGFEAWSVDPNYVSTPTTLKAAVIQRQYMCAVNITEPTSVNRVVIHARGWGGSTAIPAARFMGGIYSEAGNRVAWTGATALSNVPAAGQIPGTPPLMMDNHVGAVALPLSATYVMQPGRYWLAFLMTAGAATDFYYFHVQNESKSNAGNFFLGATAFCRNWYISGQTTLGATVAPASGLVDHDPAIMAVAMQ